MPDVQVRITTTGAEQAVAAFNQTAQASQRFAQTTQQTVTQARIATQAFSFVLLDVARIARVTGGAAGKEFANSLETAFVAVSTARGAVAAYRGVLESQILITKTLTAATIALNTATAAILSPLGLTLLAVGAVVAAYLAYEEHLRRTQRALKDTTTAQEQNALAIVNTGQALDLTMSAQERLALVLRGATRFWAEQAARIANLRERLADLKIAEDQVAQAQKDIIDTADRFQKIPNYFREIGAAATDIERPLDQLMIGLEHVEDALARVLPKEFKQFADGFKTGLDDMNIGLDKVNHSLGTGAPSAIEQMQRSFEEATASILSVTTQGTDLFSQLWVTAINAVIAKMEIAKALSSFLGGIVTGVLGFFGIHFQHGGSGIFTRPTPIMVGESGAERVSVTPLAGAPTSGGGGMTVNFNAPQFWDQITYANFIKKVGRDLTSGPVSRVG